MDHPDATSRPLAGGSPLLTWLLAAFLLVLSGCTSSSDSPLVPGADDSEEESDADSEEEGGEDDSGEEPSDDNEDPGTGDPDDPEEEDPDDGDPDDGDPSDPTAPCPPWTPDADSVLHAGALAVGTTGVVTSGTVTTLFFQGDERIEYEINVAHPDILGGLVRVREAISATRPVAKGSPILRTASGELKGAEFVLSAATLLSVQTSEDSIALEYEDVVGSRALRRRHTYTIVGKTLRIRIQSLQPDDLSWTDNYAGFTTGPAAGMESPTVLQMQGTLATPTISFEKDGKGYFYASLLDPTQSNAADLHLPEPPIAPPAATSIEYGYDTAGLYARTTNDDCAAALDETLSIIVTKNLADALVLPSQARSPYRTRLATRTVALMSNADATWAQYFEHLIQLSDWGMDDLAVYFFGFWTASAPEGSYSVGPDWAPAKSEAGFQSLADRARDAGFLIGAYTLFHGMPTTSPAYDPRDIVVDDNGLEKTGSFESADTFPMASDAGLLDDAQRESARLVDYGMTLGFVDVSTYGLPSQQGDQLDQDATSSLPKTLRAAILARKAWLTEMQAAIAGPMLGEGSIAQAKVNTEWLWAGYCDSVQRTINTAAGLQATDIPAGNPKAPTAWPVIPEYELRLAPRHQVNHGNAFYNRFFGPTDGTEIVVNNEVVFPLAEAATDRYRLYAITYGHTGFFQSNGIEDPQGNYLTATGMLKEYYLTNALQALYTGSKIESIDYFDGQYASFEDVYFAAGSTDPFVDPKLRLRYGNGLEIYLNHSEEEWAVDLQAPPIASTQMTQYVLPEDGFLAHVPGSGFFAFSGWTADSPGQRFDYCSAPGRYEFFDGRGGVEGFGTLTTQMPSGVFFKGVRVVNQVRGIDLIERAVDEVISYPVPMIPPALLSVTVLGPTAGLRVGERAALIAVGLYEGGYFRDLSTLVEWESSDDGVARIDRGGVVHGCVAGSVTVGALTFQGVAVQPASLVVVE